MSLSDQRKQSMYKYARENLKRIPLDVPKEKYEEIKTAAMAGGESVNGFIKRVVDESIGLNAQSKAPLEDNLPSYASDPVFSMLRRFCELCGITVVFSKDDDRSMARTDRVTTIEMGTDDEYVNAEHAALVLGHELSHTIEEYRPTGADLEAYNFAPFPSNDVEDLCDCWGVAIYQLAYNIVSRGVEKNAGF